MSDGVVVQVHGLAESLAAFKALEGDLRRQANGELRAAAMQVARDVVLPRLGGSGAPQDARLVAALGPRSDRLVTVAITRKPALSGLRKTPAAIAKGAVFYPVELGSDYPPFHGPAAGGIVGRHKAEIASAAVPVYEAALAGILTKYGLA